MGTARFAFEYASHMSADVPPFAFFAGDLRTFVFAKRVYATLFTLVFPYAVFANSARCVLWFGAFWWHGWCSVSSWCLYTLNLY